LRTSGGSSRRWKGEEQLAPSGTRSFQAASRGRRSSLPLILSARFRAAKSSCARAGPPHLLPRGKSSALAPRGQSFRENRQRVRLGAASRASAPPPLRLIAASRRLAPPRAQTAAFHPRPGDGRRLATNRAWAPSNRRLAEQGWCASKQIC